MLKRKQSTEAFSSDRRLLQYCQLPNKNSRYISSNMKSFPRYVQISKFLCIHSTIPCRVSNDVGKRCVRQQTLFKWLRLS